MRKHRFSNARLLAVLLVLGHLLLIRTTARVTPGVGRALVVLRTHLLVFPVEDVAVRPVVNLRLRVGHPDRLESTHNFFEIRPTLHVVLESVLQRQIIGLRRARFARLAHLVGRLVAQPDRQPHRLVEQPRELLGRVHVERRLAGEVRLDHRVEQAGVARQRQVDRLGQLVLARLFYQCRQLTRRADAGLKFAARDKLIHLLDLRGGDVLGVDRALRAFPPLVDQELAQNRPPRFALLGVFLGKLGNQFRVPNLPLVERCRCQVGRVDLDLAERLPGILQRHDSAEPVVQRRRADRVVRAVGEHLLRCQLVHPILTLLENEAVLFARVDQATASRQVFDRRFKRGDFVVVGLVVIQEPLGQPLQAVADVLVDVGRHQLRVNDVGQHPHQAVVFPGTSPLTSEHRYFKAGVMTSG